MKKASKSLSDAAWIWLFLKLLLNELIRISVFLMASSAAASMPFIVGLTARVPEKIFFVSISFLSGCMASPPL